MSEQKAVRTPVPRICRYESERIRTCGTVSEVDVVTSTRIARFHRYSLQLRIFRPITFHKGVQIDERSNPKTAYSYLPAIFRSVYTSGIMSHLFYHREQYPTTFVTKNETRNRSEKDDPRIRIRLLDESAHAYGHFFQDTQCIKTHKIQPSARNEIQYAHVLVQRHGGKRYQRVLYAARRR